MIKKLSIILFLYLMLMTFYLSTKYALVDDNQCGRCVNLCSVVCIDRYPCGFGKYVGTYFKAAFEGCKSTANKFFIK